MPRIRGINWLERGKGVLPSDIQASENQMGFEIKEGDVLLVRTGQLYRREIASPVDFSVKGSTVCHASCLPLLHQRGIGVLGTDTGNDIIQPQYPNVIQPIHQVGVVAMAFGFLITLI